jgi:glycosyltransferase involved in cell wall biosynthesis
MFDWKQQCAAVIPCFNEARKIGAVVRSVCAHVPTVFVVDDGSTDSTAMEASAAGAIVLSRSANGGKGAALRTGWRTARERGFTWALSLDGDGQHAAADIPSFFARAERTGAPLIIGNRMGQQALMPPTRRWANRWMSRCLSQLTGANLVDSQCGFRLAHLPTLLQMKLAANGFVLESEMLVELLAAGKQIEFVPIEVIYGAGRSKIRPCRDTWRWVRWWSARMPVAP